MPNTSHSTEKLKTKKKMSNFDEITDDILHNIVSRLPALSFAWAACVSKCWNKVCMSILSRPKLAAALSTNPSFHEAVKEVLEKVLSEPIRPQFAIASIGLEFSLEQTHQHISAKLGLKTPIITNAAYGIIGRDAISNTMKEVRWNFLPDENSSNGEGFESAFNPVNRGLVLMVGYLPGLKVECIPLLRPYGEHGTAMVDKFITDIKNYTATVSGCVAPAGIIIIGDQIIDIAPVLAEIEYAMPEETVIVGDATSRFLCRSGPNCPTYVANPCFFDAAALVFARDKDKAPGLGEIRFHSSLSTGVMPFGPKLKTVSVASKAMEYSWISARMSGYHEMIDIHRLLYDIHDEVLQNGEHCADFYIGVIQKRASLVEPEKKESRTYMSFHQVLGGDGDYLVINNSEILPGDAFLFYHSDTATASSSCLRAYERIRDVKEELSSSNRNSMREGEVIGGMIFSCHFLGESHHDIFPFYGNFDRAPIAGVICYKQIGRDPTGSSTWHQKEGKAPARCTLHVCSSVYLVMSYLPPPHDD